jgi:3-oxoacyl-[acyl-carrier protein] reductase
MRLKDKVAIVTGGAHGMGEAEARLFAREGAAVVIADVLDREGEAVASQISAIQGRARFIRTDVTSERDWERLIGETIATYGRLDILVNNAGIAGINKTVWETDLEEWRKVLRVNLEGPFICCRAVVPSMIRQNYGRIVNIASIAGKEGNPNAAHYSASKAGLIALTKSLGKELAGHDIAVNAVTPAAARTAIFEQMTQAHIDFMLSKIPKGRFVLVEEVAAMAAWLASADCAFSTGAVFDISGGRATY